MSAQYSQLPQYSDNDIKTPLLNDQPVYLTVGPIQEAGELRVGNGDTDKMSCWARMRARCAERCAARRAAKYGPPCDNPGCQYKERRRRKIRFFIFGFIALFALVHLFKGAYVSFFHHLFLMLLPKPRS